jgi:hypothetical protein
MDDEGQVQLTGITDPQSQVLRITAGEHPEALKYVETQTQGMPAGGVGPVDDRPPLYDGTLYWRGDTGLRLVIRMFSQFAPLGLVSSITLPSSF